MLLQTALVLIGAVRPSRLQQSTRQNKKNIKKQSKSLQSRSSKQVSKIVRNRLSQLVNRFRVTPTISTLVWAVFAAKPKENNGTTVQQQILSA